MNLSPSQVDILKFFSLVADSGTYSEIANWPAYLADYLGRIRGEYTLNLKNGIDITLEGGSTAKWPIQEIILRDDYRLLPLRKDPPATIIDLGASVGVFSLYCKTLFPKATVFAFEPDLPTFRLLQRNIKANGFETAISPFPIACHSQQVVHQLHTKKAKAPFKRKGPEWVFRYTSAISLEDIFFKNRIGHADLVKIDVEGAEYNILYSLPAWVFQRIRRIHLEYHNLDPSSDLNGRSLKRFLETKKYRVIQDHRRLRKIGMLFAVRQRGR